MHHAVAAEGNQGVYAVRNGLPRECLRIGCVRADKDRDVGTALAHALGDVGGYPRRAAFAGGWIDEQRNVVGGGTHGTAGSSSSGDSSSSARSAYIEVSPRRAALRSCTNANASDSPYR